MAPTMEMTIRGLYSTVYINPLYVGIQTHTRHNLLSIVSRRPTDKSLNNKTILHTNK